MYTTRSSLWSECDQICGRWSDRACGSWGVHNFQCILSRGVWRVAWRKHTRAPRCSWWCVDIYIKVHMFVVFKFVKPWVVLAVVRKLLQLVLCVGFLLICLEIAWITRNNITISDSQTNALCRWEFKMNYEDWVTSEKPNLGTDVASRVEKAMRTTSPWFLSQKMLYHFFWCTPFPHNLVEIQHRSWFAEDCSLHPVLFKA